MWAITHRTSSPTDQPTRPYAPDRGHAMAQVAQQACSLETPIQKWPTFGFFARCGLHVCECARSPFPPHQAHHMHHCHAHATSYTPNGYPSQCALQQSVAATERWYCKELMLSHMAATKCCCQPVLRRSPRSSLLHAPDEPAIAPRRHLASFSLLRSRSRS